MGRFEVMFGQQAASAGAYAMQDRFCDVIDSQMRFFSTVKIEKTTSAQNATAPPTIVPRASTASPPRLVQQPVVQLAASEVTAAQVARMAEASLLEAEQS